MKKTLLFLLFIPFIAFSQTTITTSGNTFSPDTVILYVGDSVHFTLLGTHNAVEVNNTTWIANGTVSNGGFNVGYGLSEWIIINSVQTYYYVCQSHVGAFGMKGVIIANLPGCMDPTACNYDPTATIDDGSCILPDGCTDPTACNYDSTAICDDGSCNTIYGCMDVTSCNYDATATCDDGSCNLPDGCTDPTACNYDATAICDDGSCNLPDGCTDPTACNYDATAICDDGSCNTIYGCTDALAVNYNSSANCDDGSCLIAGFTSDIVCEGDTTTFTDLSSGNISTWNWNFGDGNTSLDPNPSHTYLTCGQYLVTLLVTDNIGITSTNTDTIQVLCPSNTTITTNACVSYTWIIGSDTIGTYTSSTLDTSYGFNASGCTEEYVLDLTINGSSTYTNLTECDSYTWPINGVTYTNTGLYIDSSYNSFNCIHVDTLALWMNYSTISITTDTACDSYTWNGQTYTSSIVDTIVGSNPVGCPDTNILNLTINHSDTAYINITSCDSYTSNGQTYYTSGVYGCCVGLTTVAGCDSVVWLNLTINYSTTNIDTITTCGSYTWSNGATYTSSVVDTVVGLNAVGCPDTSILNLTINYETTINVSIVECDSYTWPISGLTYTTSIVDSIIDTNAAGCSETYILYLTINNSSSTYTNLTACDSYTWPTDFQLYTTTGIYSLTTTNNAGCTHIDTLDLTINYSSSGSTSITECDTYTWEGQTVTSADTLTYTYVNGNAAGCDSTHILMIDINYSNAGSSSYTACDSYNWNGVTYNSSGSYNQTLTNVAGCDSITTLNLTINPSTTSLHGADSICDQYTWNGVTYTTTGIYTWIGMNENGCDSTATLDLIIRNSTISNLDTVITCPDNSYFWNGQTYNMSGTYSWIGINSVGCDSTATLNLTINDAEYNVDSFFVCSDSTVVVGNTFYSIPGLFTDTLVNSNGCLSISGIYIEHLNIPLNPMTVPNPPEVCLGDSVVIEVNPNFANYWWNTGNPSDQGENRVVVFPTQDFTYVIEALDMYGCDARSEILVIVDTCVNSLTDNTLTKIEVYPNPSQNVFNVNFNILQDQSVQLRVVNSIGKVVFTEYLKDYIGRYSTKIILDNHSKGIYLLQIITDKLIINKKLILQ
ncbi:MAG: PKD domain-containing protein [Flavobacteriales bacterium]